ncbi:hypothetical protein [Desulfonema magnum]|uniref:Phosphorylase domain-containing protein n=1 Tax=Desulfonema magnum TaxID=45655 RepID=A0A975GTN0_9BACT|nr:hypothetical protein [Desulfonema magnum]QTA93269.1 phosphorylase domain-containing protein [Desulfonema magnum]
MLKRDSQVDVLLITTLRDELEIILEAEPDWQDQEDSKGVAYYTRNVNGNMGNGFSFAVMQPIDMEKTSASDDTCRLMNELKPRWISMVGVCPGRQGKMALGDVVVAERMFHYDAGKIKAFHEGGAKKEDAFNEITNCNFNSLWIQNAQNFSSDWVRTIKSRRPAMITAVSDKPTVHITPMGTETHTEENPELFPLMNRHIRKIFETANVEKADSCLIVKTVTDHTDDEKDDHFRLYAIETSYRFLMAFLKNNLLQSGTWELGIRN